MAKTQFNRIAVSPKRVLAALASLVVGFILLVAVVDVAQKYFGIKRHINELAREQEALQAKQEALVRTNDYLATKEGQEQALRDKYNIVKPGEGMIVVSGGELPAEVKKSSIAVRWWHAILRGLGIKKE